MIHCKECLVVFTNSVGSGTTLCKECQAKGDPDIFDTQPTCGELSCDECNERYEKAMERIKALEDVVRELVKALDGTYFTCSSDIDCEFCDDMAGLRRRSLELVNGGK